jgi:hypothetical protein
LKKKIKEMKTINIEAMKTRILATALMIIATSGVIANPVNFPVALVELNNAGLEEWVDSRESWESEATYTMVSEGMEAVNLEGWFDSRESWEQNDSEVPSLSTPIAAVELEEWIGELTSWEQESSSYDLAEVAYFNNIEDWFSARETWEQSVSGSDLARQYEGTVQQEWINTRESWEQK